MKKIQLTVGVFCFAVFVSLNAQTPAEVKLVAPLDEDRGWCLDLRGSRSNAAPIGGVHGHTCYTYQGNGVALDQGFIIESIQDDNEFRMSGFPNLCMTIYEPKAGSFVSIETCDGRATQDFVMDAGGLVISQLQPDLCLTLDSVVLPGGGGNPLHIMRDVTFEECGSVATELQSWEFRSEWRGLVEASMPRTYEVSSAPATGP